MNFQRKVIHYVISTITSCEKNDRIGKKNKKIETKYGWETLDVIPLFPLEGVNHRQTILHMYKRMVHLYATYEKIINL